jgi:hypothetical protein
MGRVLGRSRGEIFAVFQSDRGQSHAKYVVLDLFLFLRILFNRHTDGNGFTLYPSGWQDVFLTFFDGYSVQAFGDIFP